MTLYTDYFKVEISIIRRKRQNVKVFLKIGACPLAYEEIGIVAS